MNGGTNRGQADGFQLSVLNKIRDVKTQVSIDRMYVWVMSRNSTLMFINTFFPCMSIFFNQSSTLRRNKTTFPFCVLQVKGKIIGHLSIYCIVDFSSGQ